jgi:hypothetical protein
LTPCLALAAVQAVDAAVLVVASTLPQALVSLARASMEAREALLLVAVAAVVLLSALLLQETMVVRLARVLQIQLAAHPLPMLLAVAVVLLALVVLVELAQVMVVRVVLLVVLQLVTVVVVAVLVLALLVQASKALSLFVTSLTKKGRKWLTTTRTRQRLRTV